MTREEALAAMDREYAELVDDYVEVTQQRDEYREEWMNSAHTSLRVQHENDQLRKALEAVYDFCHAERQRIVAPRAWVLARRVEKLLESHGFGGES